MLIYHSNSKTAANLQQVCKKSLQDNIKG